jgi:nitrite reductase/ring-hydroxylating ferredoxin subunit
VVLEAVGVALVTCGGWLGGTLVYRNQIGVDHRYAGAGKWREQSVDGRAGEAVTVARVGDLEINQMKLVHVGARRIVLARGEAGYVAFDDRCSHKGGPLADGAMICGTVQCPWHGSQFDAQTGTVKAGPASQAIATYRVDVAGDEVRLVLP